MREVLTSPYTLTEHVVLPERKILTFEECVDCIDYVKRKGKIAVYTSGVFDVIHPGHIDFLRSAKAAGDFLFVGVESDQTVRLNKGETRPFHTVAERIDVLSELMSVDFVFPFCDVVSYFGDDEQFLNRYAMLNPNRIAVLESDVALCKKQKHAEEVGCQIALIKHIKRDSTSRILKLSGWE